MIYIIIILSLLLMIAIYFAIKFALIIINIQEIIEESLDILDEKYSIISNILSIPIFYDSKEIKEVLNEIKGVKDAILYIAQKLSSNKEKIEEDEDIYKTDSEKEGR
jgi:hypothetical protein